ncbi:ABC transporter ATP-binding protein [Sulfurimonas sp.]|uniref:ABC transporter ATP-binding protein n=1 Tax=Sulfurimonas sp. TaxID=2022749 RepID=UPI0019EFC6DA|nr:ABC transporter ATP-binding protein [Sulfurimonas sp.]MBE0514908.1 ABC transporter ATP-binding protein [Sulfurimonas sp.]
MLQIIKNVLTILLANKKKEFVSLIGLMFVLSFMELIGLGILLPIINMISNPDSLSNNSSIIFLKDLLHVSDINLLIYIVLFLLVLFFVLKSLSALFVIYKQQIFVNTLFVNLSTKILEQSMSLKYNEFRIKDKSLYLKDIINSSAFLALCTFNVLQLFTEIFVLIAILFFMGFYIGILNIVYIISAILVLAYLFKTVTKNISHYGQQRDKIMHDITKTATEALSGYKEIRNNNVLDSVMNEYETRAAPYIKTYANFGTISNVPKITLETITALIIIGYVFYIYFSGIPLVDVMQNLIIFAFVGLRTIPSLTKILGTSAQIKYFGTESEKFRQLFSYSSTKINYEKSIETFDESITFKNINYKYPSKQENVLKDISFVIEKNKKYGFVGKSGSGKSTLFDIVLGLNSPDSGSIIVDGNMYSSFENIDITKLIGMVSQSIFILDGSYEKNILFFDKNKDNELLEESINGAQLKELIDNDINHLVGEDGKNLSGGQKQRLAIARALYKNKNILLLDEATSALDNETERRFINYLNTKKDHTVLIIAHRLSTVQDCDKIFVLKDGEIIDSGTYDELLDNSIEFQKLVNSGEFNNE